MYGREIRHINLLSLQCSGVKHTPRAVTITPSFSIMPNTTSVSTKHELPQLPGPGHPTPPPSQWTREVRTPAGHPSEDVQRQGVTPILGLKAEMSTGDKVGTCPRVGQPADSPHLSHGKFAVVPLACVQPRK